MDDYSQLDTVVYGINPGKFEGHQKFAKKNNFNFPLVHDESWQIIAEYRVSTFAALMVSRTVMILDKDMKVRYINKGMPSTEELKAELAKLEA